MGLGIEDPDVRVELSVDGCGHQAAGAKQGGQSEIKAIWSHDGYFG